MLDPIKLAKITEKQVCRKHNDTVSRRYWRFRGGLWYGGAATADCVGCNLRCKFCGPLLFMLQQKAAGKFRKPSSVANALASIAFKRKYKYARISGGEPTICFEHLIQVIAEMQKYPFLFIVETNGILLGANKKYSEILSEFPNIHVRVSLKGTNEIEFEELTMASGKFYQYQIEAIKNLLDAEVSFHPAVVASFTTKENILKLRQKLFDISKEVADSLEVEYIVLYPHVVKSLIKHKLIPTKAYTTEWHLIGSEEFKILYLSKNQ